MNDYESLELLLVCGANPNIVDDHKSETPLIEAARLGDIGSVKLLLQYGADAATRTDHGESAEDIAKSYADIGSDALIDLLREHSSQSLAGMHRISPSVQRIMKDHGLVPKPHNELLGTRLSWQSQEIGYRGLRKRKFEDDGE